LTISIKSNSVAVKRRQQQQHVEDRQNLIDDQSILQVLSTPWIAGAANRKQGGREALLAGERDVVGGTGGRD
jgi:hypothetical protein